MVRSRCTTSPGALSSCGALLRLCEAICDLFRFYVRATMLGLRGRYRTMISNCRRRRLGPAGILGFRATVTPLSGSVTLCRWSHRFSIAVDSMIVERRHLLLPTDSSCEQRREHSNDALPPRMCQFLWGAGMTILTAPGNLLAILPKEETGVELVPGPHRRAAPWVHSGIWLSVRGFACKIETAMAQRSPRPSEDEAASDAAFTYLIGLLWLWCCFKMAVSLGLVGQ
jgi:hypothetical protein